MSLLPQGWSKEALKRRVRFAYGDPLAAENRNDGDVQVFGSNGVVGAHDRSITESPAIVIGRKGSSGKLSWSDAPCFPIDTTYFVDQRQTRENLRWLFHALDSLGLDKINFDSAVPGLSRELAYSLPLVFPPLPEQQRIAAYLDASCAAIDAAVSAKRRQLDTLDALRKTTIHRSVTQGLNPDVKMKSASTDWLSEVPAHWTLSRIKNVAKLSPGYSGRAPTNDEVCTFVPMELLSEAGTLDTTSLLAFEDVSTGLTQFEVGDVLFAKITPCMENGKGAFVESLSTRYAFGSTEFHVLRPRDVIDGKFLYYYTYNPIYRTFAAENMSGAAGQKRVSSRFLKETRLFVPPLPEQLAISAFLTDKDKEFHKLFVQITAQIATLIAYRKSLIHECVTGQRRVTEADVLAIV
jgi:type I restriction enzyme S subunit